MTSTGFIVSFAALLSEDKAQQVANSISVNGVQAHVASHPELMGRTLVLRSFSKTHAMPAWRIGFAQRSISSGRYLAR